MKRYYITPIIPHPTRTGFFGPKIGFTYEGRPFTNLTPVLPDGNATTGFALVALETPDHRDAIADADNDTLPDLTLDTVIGSFWNNTVKTRLTSRGFDVTSINTQSTFRQLLRIVGQTLGAKFDENNFDVRV